MHLLTLHPDCPTGPIETIHANIEVTHEGCRATFILRGDIGAIHVPENADPVREDFLWKRTCAEIFWQPEGGSYYREFNLSPSSKWAAYDFSAFRELMGDAPAERVAITCDVASDKLTLTADIASALPLPAKVALNMIVEDAKGTLSNWALAFDPGPYEFHSETCRVIELEKSA